MHRVVVFFALTSIFNVNVVQADWPQWRGPNRSGYLPSATPLIQSLPPEGIAPTWAFENFPGGNNGGWSSPVVRDGCVYLFAHTKTKNPDRTATPSKYPWLSPEKRVGMSDEEYAEYEVKRRNENEKQSKAFRFDERLVCLQLDTGTILWERSEPSKYTRFVQSGTPCITDNYVLVLGAERTAHCFDAKTGETVWSQRLPGEFRDEFFASSFAVADGVALIACGPLVALRIADGELLWQGDAPTDYQSHSSPAVWMSDQGAIAVANTARGITQAYRVSDGSKLWELQSGAGQSTPIVNNDWLLTYGSSRKNGLKAFQLDPSAPTNKPEMKWQFQRAADSGSTPVVYKGHIFVQGDKRLAKLDLANGKSSWQTTLRISNPRYTSLIATGDQVFYAWEGVLAFNADSDRFETLYEAKIDADRFLIAKDDLRKKLKIDEISSQPDGAAASEKLWQRQAIRSGPLGCSTPAFSDGRMIVRLRDTVVCYDLRQR
ncbi:MAG: PQQ-binding-like beta-propeller repeat protein [Planctomycetota bacterium]